MRRLPGVNFDSPAQIHLVQLVETGILQGAPTWDDQTGSLIQGWDDDAFEYWSQHVTMTRVKRTNVARRVLPRYRLSIKWILREAA